MRRLSSAALSLIVLLSLPVYAKVTFDSTGTTLIDGKRFFPIGIYLYGFNTDILAEVHQQGFNTVIWGAKPSDIGTIREHGLMTLQPPTDEWLAVKDNPAILGWYLSDEPEMRMSPEEFYKEYQRVKGIDPTHPIGTCHYDWDAMRRYAKGEDYVMISSYPILAKRTVPLYATGQNIDWVHTIRPANIPVWPAIQTFGGPETDNGIWALPTPAEVRCMTYVALVHDAKGILFFSYWPQAPRTWNEVGVLCRELHHLTPYLILPGKKLGSKASENRIHTRCIKIGDTGILIAVNTDLKFHQADIKVDNLPTNALALPFEGRRISVKKGAFTDRFAPHEVHVYQWGETPVE